MNGEKLFLALSYLEDDRLARSEIQAPASGGKPRRLKILLVAAAILSTLALTACAVVRYALFDSPEEMLAAIFGDKTGFDHRPATQETDPDKPDSPPYVVPGHDRVPADPGVVESLTPHVSPVGQSLTFHGLTLTVDSYLYDSKTQCGVVTYLLIYDGEIPEYYVNPNGQFDFYGSPALAAGCNHYGYSYLIQDKTQGNTLALQYYFKYDRWWDEELYLQAQYEDPETSGDDRGRQCSEAVHAQYSPEEAIAAAIEYTGQEEFDSFAGQFIHYVDEGEDYRAWAAYVLLVDKMLQEMPEVPEETSEKIPLDIRESTELTSLSLGGGRAFLSPISLQLNTEDGNADVQTLAIRFTDGTEYVIVDKGVENLVFWRSAPPNDTPPEALPTAENTQTTVMFNRLIDVDQVAALVVNGEEITPD